MVDRIQAWDNRVLVLLAKKHTPFLNRLMVYITATGDNGFVWFALSVPFLLLNQWRLTGFTILAAMGIATLSGELTIKNIVKRVRPCNKAFEEYLLIENPPHYSFPSGHTTASFAVAAVTAAMCPVLAPAVMMYASLISFSRLYLLVHYPTDVLAGIAIGVICGLVAIPVAGSIPLFTFQL